eukprot:TRINITY_DN6579_c0_g4_i1.p1 TRINITY_DN6579_c0_g4~~TRINITY_DN6579_c0_g4_i1.p1  ORF type:complete len:540 (-),score=111.63 TRINITY_DN6579_c0_g4_i1:63-1682(-)
MSGSRCQCQARLKRRCGNVAGAVSMFHSRFAAQLSLFLSFGIHVLGHRIVQEKDREVNRLHVSASGNASLLETSAYLEAEVAAESASAAQHGSGASAAAEIGSVTQHETLSDAQLGNPTGCVREIDLQMSAEEQWKGGMFPSHLHKAYYDSMVEVLRDAHAEGHVLKPVGALNLPPVRRCFHFPETRQLIRETHPLDRLIPGFRKQLNQPRQDTETSSDFHQASAGLLEMNATIQSAKVGLGTRIRTAFEQQFNKLPKKTPLVLLAVEWDGTNAKRETFGNFFCNLKKFGLEEKSVVFALDQQSANMVVEEMPLSVVFYNGVFVKSMKEQPMSRSIIGDRPNLVNRVAKIWGAAMLLELGHDVLVTDVDSYWFSNPIPYLQKEEHELTVMQDNCNMDLNSGFVYYRSTPVIRRLLKAALLSKKPTFHDGRYYADTDNDQYILNCAIHGAAALDLVKPFLLSKETHAFGNLKRSCETGQLGKGFVVWHTSLMSARSKPETRKRGLWDLMELSDGSAGGCKCYVRGEAWIRRAQRMACYHW